MLPSPKEIRKAESDIAKLQSALARLTAAAGHLAGYAKGDLTIHPWLSGITVEAIKSTPKESLGHLFGVSDELGGSLIAHSVNLVRDKPREKAAGVLQAALIEAERVVRREDRKVDLFRRLVNPKPQDRAEWLVDLGRRLCVVFAAAKKPEAKAEEWEGNAQAGPGQPRADGLKPTVDLLPLLDGWKPNPYSPAEEVSALSTAFAHHFVELEKRLQSPIPSEWAECGPAIWEALTSGPTATITKSIENALAPVDCQPTAGPAGGVVHHLHMRPSGAQFKAIRKAGEHFTKAFAAILPMLRSGTHIRHDRDGEPERRPPVNTFDPSWTEPDPTDTPMAEPETDAAPRALTESSRTLLNLLSGFQDAIREFTHRGTSKLAPMLEAQARLKAWWLANGANFMASVRIRNRLDRILSAELVNTHGVSTAQVSADIMTAIRFIHEASDEEAHLIDVGVGGKVADEGEETLAPQPVVPATNPEPQELPAKPILNGPDKDIEHVWWVNGKRFEFQSNNQQILMLRHLFFNPQAVDAQSAVEWGLVDNEDVGAISTTSSRAGGQAAKLGLDWTVAIKSIQDRRAGKTKIMIHRKPLTTAKPATKAVPKKKAGAGKPPKRAR